MKSIKKRVLVILSCLALALIMGAVGDGADYEQDSVGNTDFGWRIAGHSDSHGGG